MTTATQGTTPKGARRPVCAGAHRTLERQEEARLLALVADGRAAAAELAEGADPARRAELEALVRSAEDARTAVIQAHQDYVAMVVRRYRPDGVPLADLVQEGNIGLLAALDRFDPSRGVRFATFAFYWIRRTVVAALPRHLDRMAASRSVAREANRVRKVRVAMEAAAGRPPTAAEVAAAANMGVPRVSRLEQLATNLVPLNDAIARCAVDVTDDGDPATRLAEAPPDIRKMLEDLPARERFVIASRYGFASAPPQLQSQVAETLGVTVSRVSQIEKKALEHLRRRLLAAA